MEEYEFLIYEAGEVEPVCAAIVFATSVEDATEKAIAETILKAGPGNYTAKPLVKTPSLTEGPDMTLTKARAAQA